MKGIVLAGGLGTRLDPLTRITNKHLLPVFKLPMVYYPIQALMNVGVTDILIVTGGNSAGDFLKLLGNGSELGLKHINYTYQAGEGGIAAALSLAEYFSAGERICVILGDNIIQGNFKASADAFQVQKSGARLLLKPVKNPQRFGVPVFEGDKIVRIEEKPENPASDFAVTGIYMYDADVFDIVRTLKPSGRGELEITDVNNAYIARGDLGWDVLDGWWTDAGTHESLRSATNLVAETGANKLQLEAAKG
jgi:glucose-1-phosphate thymidylyltransferase